jgi:hypothetical protein
MLLHWACQRLDKHARASSHTKTSVGKKRKKILFSDV